MVRPLGRGAMGQVHLAHDQLLDRLVAVKFIAAPEPSPAARERFLVEARAVARLQHPNVVSVFRVGDVGGRPFLVSEYLRGTSLQTLDKPVRPERALEIGAALARGLAAAHRQGVLHRDIKPANAFLCEDGTVKLLDFGLAKLLDAQSLGDRPPPAGTNRPHAWNDAEAFPPSTPPPASHRAPGPDETAPSEATPLNRSSPAPSLSAERRRELTHAGAFLGSPLYMAPELWRGEPATPRSDVFSLGVVLFELLAGRAPLYDVEIEDMPRRAQEQPAPALASAAPGVDPRLCRVVDRCLHLAPGERFESGEALREALEQVALPVLGAILPEGNPYRGLLAFEQEHQALFFGRGGDVRAVIDRLRSEPFVLVTADSGVGKSSLCRAGVVPAVAHGGLAGAPVAIASLDPGRRPIGALAAALGLLLHADEAELASTLLRDPADVGRRLRRQLGAGSALLFVDALEELFTTAEPEQTRQASLALAALALDAPGLKLLAAVRSDFLAQAAALPRLGDAVGRALYLLRPLSPEGVREAVVGPARAKGFSLETPAMEDALVVSAQDEGALPLLQFTLTELWELRDPERRILTERSLAELGGVGGCLARHGDGVLAALLPSQREVARQVLLDLVTAEGTRSRRTGAELSAHQSDRRAVLEALVRSRLLLARESDVPGEATYQIAHEALLKHWGTLRGWLESSADQKRIHGRLERAAAEWDRMHRVDDGLWGERQLAEAQRLDRQGLRPLEREFLQRSTRVAAVRRWRRRAVRFGLPAAVVLALLPFAKTRYDRAQALAVYLRVAESAWADARGSAREAGRARAEAFARFDHGDSTEGEAAWSRARTLGRQTDAAYGQAADAFEHGLSFDERSLKLRARLADLLLERILQAEERGQPADALRGRLAALDDSGDRRRQLAAPAQLSLSTRPGGAEVQLERYERAGGRYVSEVERRLGTSPVPLVDMAPGSLVLALRAEGRAPVRLPVLARRGEHLVLEVDLPPASAVPPGFVYVPPGRFLYGHGGEEDEVPRLFLNAQPLHEVTTGAYLIGAHEVTFAEWLEYLRALPRVERARRRPATRTSFHGIALEELHSGDWRLVLEPQEQRYVARLGQPIRYPGRTKRAVQDWRKFPVSAITYEDAAAYTRWLDATGRVPGARICDDHEWERAARGADGRRYPGGEELEPDDINFDLTYGRVPTAYGPDEVGSHPQSRSPFGVDDLSGNVWEWTHAVGDPSQPVNRGGSWYLGRLSSQAPNRELSEANHRDPLLGLRVCAQPPRRE